MMDVLLEWMSFRGTGRIADLPPDLVDEGSRRQIVETLAMLGHVEFMSRDIWRIAPPVLAGLPTNGVSWDAVLCGARTSGLLARLRAACGRFGAEISMSHAADGPTNFRVSSSRCSALEAAADEAEITFQRNSAFTLLACTPTIREWPRTPCAMVSGRVETVRRFSRSKLGWLDSSLDEARELQRGFFRIKRDWDWVSIIKMGAEKSAYIDDRAGRLIVAAKLKVVSWNPELGTFSIPRRLFPPRLIARALVLCEGTLPHFEQTSGRISYANVPLEIVRLALAITGLRLT